MRVEPVGQLASCGHDLAVTHGRKPVGVAGQDPVDPLPVRHRQAAGLPGQQGGSPLGDVPGPERSQRVRHLGGQDLRQSQVLPALVRRLPPRQCHLLRDPSALPRSGNSPCGRERPLGPVEVRGQHRLCRLRRALQLLQRPHHVDPLRIRGLPVDPGQGRSPRRDTDGVQRPHCGARATTRRPRTRCFEHVFDPSVSHRQPARPEHESVENSAGGESRRKGSGVSTTLRSLRRWSDYLRTAAEKAGRGGGGATRPTRTCRSDIHCPRHVRTAAPRRLGRSARGCLALSRT